MRSPVLLALALALLAFAAGCGSDVVIEGDLTDGGSFAVDADTTEVGTGWQDVDLTIVDAGTGEALEGLVVEVEPYMTSMGHGSSEETEVEDLGEGVYRVHAYYTMPGTWDLLGTVGDGSVIEDFTLTVESVEGG